MAYLTRSLVVLTLIVGVAACSKGGSSAGGGGGGGGGDKPGASPFTGIWLERSIEEFRTHHDPKFICSHIENGEWTGYKNELLIDGYVIHADGAVHDFRIDPNELTGALWKVQNDGSTVDNIVLRDYHSQDGSEIIGYSMTKINDGRLSSNWQMRLANGTEHVSQVEYVLMTDAEIAQIREIFAGCPVPAPAGYHR